MVKKKATSKENIIAFYTDYVLEHIHNPNSTRVFSKVNNFKEPYFYKSFASLEAIETGIFETFFFNTLEVLNKTEDTEVIINAKHLCVSSIGIKDDTSLSMTTYIARNFNNSEKIAELQNYINK